MSRNQKLVELLQQLNVESAHAVTAAFESSLSMPVMELYQASSEEKGIEFAFLEFVASVSQLKERGDQLGIFSLVLGLAARPVVDLLPLIKPCVADGQKICGQELIQKMEAAK